MFVFSELIVTWAVIGVICIPWDGHDIGTLVGLKRVHRVTLPTGAEAREASVDSCGILVTSLFVIVAFAAMAVQSI